MSTLNKVMIIGNLGKDPEVRCTSSGIAIANLAIATEEKWKDQQGNPQSKTEWHRVVLYRRQAEVAGEYLKIGSKVYIEGKLQTKKWKDQQGNDRYTTEIAGYEMKMLGGGGNSGTGRQNNHQSQPEQQSQQPDFDDDVPF